MKKRLSSLLLALTLLLPLLPAAQAAEGEVVPTPPAWCPEEEYAVFPGSAAYEPENWEVLTACRREVSWGPIGIGSLARRRQFDGLPSEDKETGELDFGVLFEQSLVCVRLLYTHDNVTGNYWPYTYVELKDGGDPRLDSLTDQQRYAILLWTARGVLRYRGVGEELNKYLPYLMEFPQFRLETLTDSPIFTDEERERLKGEVARSWAEYQDNIQIWLDGRALPLDVPPEVKNQRTMVPIRAVAEALGADVSWLQDTRQVVLVRAGVLVTMTLDSTTATVNGTAVEMDVAPYATGGRTLIPARYVAEFFGQKVDWDSIHRRVLITEDKSVAGDSNLEAWALPMGAMLVKINNGDPRLFGLTPRNATDAATCEGILNGGSWNIPTRTDLANTVLSMTFAGHNATFLEMAADVKTRSAEERAAISAASSAWPAYMWEYTEQLDKKWGDRGILCWDLFRMSNLVQWGYAAGYLTYGEALELLEPAAILLSQNFSSWDEAYENYLDGYNWWARNNMLDQDIWKTQRGQIYLDMKSRKATAPLFDDTLFATGVIPLPGHEAPQ